MSIILHRHSSYSLFPSCTDPLSGNSANKHTGRRSSRRISASREATDISLYHGPKRNNNTIESPSAMGRMIPFKLQASQEKRLSSTSSQPTATPSISSTNSRTTPRKRRPGPVTDLIIIPYTEEEWKTVMEEVKILYLKGQYKHCSTRCQQLLCIKDANQTHPLYSIYLCFFTASSLEMTARSLHNHSSNKLPLFQEALSFYKKAESYVEYASFSADPNLIHATRRSTHRHSNSSISSSIRSSVDSVFSQTSTTSTSSSGADSPTNADHPPPLPQKGPPSVSTTSSSILRMKKKVSFSPKLSTLPSESELLSETTLIEAFLHPPPAQEETAPPPPPEKDQADLCTLSSYLLTQSITRYRAQLTALSAQLSYHITSIHAQIATLSEIRRTRRSNLPNLFFEGWREASGAIEGVSREEVVKVELRERIRRLKEKGWKRERFDGERYRVLCERALVEVEEGV